MPYIPQSQREAMEKDPGLISNPGHLNYKLTKFILAKEFVDMDDLQFNLDHYCQTFFAATTKNYQASNDIIGALNCCALEFKRRFHDGYGRDRKKVLRVLELVASNFYTSTTAPYEDVKIEENGDVI